MSTHQNIEPAEDDGTPTPDLTHVASDASMRRAARAFSRRSGRWAEPILAELGIEMLGPPLVGFRYGQDHYQRIYGIQARLTTVLDTVLVVPGADISDAEALTDVGRALVEEVFEIFGVSTIYLNRYDALICIGTAFVWADGIHERILQILNRLVSLHPEEGGPIGVLMPAAEYQENDGVE
jgi:hypothetical protein